MKDEAKRRVSKAATDARSEDDLIGDDLWMVPEEPASPLDRETLGEAHSTQMGEMWESRRRGAS